MANSLKRILQRFGKGNAASYETNTAHGTQDRTHEFNTSIGSAYLRMLESSDGMPYTIQEIRTFTKNPMVYIEQIRRLAHWAYHTNGVVAGAIDYMKSLHTLDTVITCKSRKATKAYPKRYRTNRAKMEAVLHTIRYKQVIRDAIFRNANDGMYTAYFETANAAPNYRPALTDLEVEGITEINALGINAMVIPLPVAYTRIIGRCNNSYQIAFDLRYFMNFPEDIRKTRLQGFPKEIQKGWIDYESGRLAAPWLRLDHHKTIVTKIKSEITDPYGIPFAIAALDDVSYAQYFVDSKRNVLDSVNHQIVYETFPEGKEKGTSALTEKQQKNQHDLIKGALRNQSGNASGTSFFSLAAGTKLDRIPLDVSLLDEKNESAIKDAVNKDLNISASALDGSSTGNYSTANLNFELVASSVYTWIEDIVDELNKCINYNIIADPNCRVEFYILPITMVNRDSMVGYMADLYARGKGSLSAWIAATGFNPDTYVALMDYELEEDFENRYPVHRTSFTVTKDDKGGRPQVSSDDPAAVQQKTNGANHAPKPSTG